MKNTRASVRLTEISYELVRKLFKLFTGSVPHVQLNNTTTRNTQTKTTNFLIIKRNNYSHLSRYIFILDKTKKKLETK